MNIINLLSDNNNNRKEFLYNEYNENNEYKFQYVFRRQVSSNSKFTSLNFLPIP